MRSFLVGLFEKVLAGLLVAGIVAGAVRYRTSDPSIVTVVDEALRIGLIVGVSGVIVVVALVLGGYLVGTSDRRHRKRHGRWAKERQGRFY
jgi:hypothetical protein